MSKVMNALMEGKAKEFKATVKGVVRFIVELDGKFYTNNAGRFIPVAKSKITPFIESSITLQ